MSPEFSGVKNIVDILFHAHQVALKINWPEPERLSLLRYYDVLLDVVGTSTYKNDFNLNLKNPLIGRGKYFPFATLFAQPFNRKVTPQQKEVMLLLVLMFYQILRNANFDKSKENQPLIDTANSLRSLISSVNEKHESFHFTIKASFFDYNKLKDNLSKVIQVAGDHKLELLSNLWSAYTQTLNEEVESDTFPYLQKDTGGFPVTEKESEDASEKSDSLLYGSRLTINELLHLPWRANVLADHEIRALITFLYQSLKDEKLRKQAIFALLVMLTSKPFKIILKTEVSVNGNSNLDLSGDYIDLKEKCWVRKSIKMPSSYSQNYDHKKCLSDHTQWLRLAFPDNLISAISIETKKLGIANKITISDICCFEKSISWLLSGFLKALWQSDPNIHRRITPASLRAATFEKLSLKYDSTIAALILGNTEYTNPAVLYYVSADTKQLENHYQSTLSEMGINTNNFSLNSNTLTGSELVFEPGYIRSCVKKKVEILSEMLAIDGASLSFDEIINRHNFFHATSA